MCVFITTVYIYVLLIAISKTFGLNDNDDNSDKTAEQKIFNFKRWGDNKCLSRKEIQAIIEKDNLIKINMVQFDHVTKNATPEINMAVNKEDNQIGLPPLLPFWSKNDSDLLKEFDYLINQNENVELIKPLSMQLETRYKMALLGSIEARINRLEMILKKKIGAHVAVLRVDGQFYKAELFDFLTDVGFGTNEYKFYSYRQLQQAKEEISALLDILGIYFYKNLREYWRSEVNKMAEQLNSDILLTHRVLSIKGERGYDGAPGQKGFKGFKGDSGSPGKVGDTGDKGSKGERGIKGMKGIKGKRYDLKEENNDEFLFEYYKTMYFDDVECNKSQEKKQWTVYQKKQFGLKGLKGIKGMKGDRGTIGERGPPGDDAVVEKVVFQGLPGQPGRQGYNTCNMEQSSKMSQSVQDEFWLGEYRLQLRKRVEIDRQFSRLERFLPNLKNKIKRFYNLNFIK